MDRLARIHALPVVALVFAGCGQGAATSGGDASTGPSGKDAGAQHDTGMATDGSDRDAGMGGHDSGGGGEAGSDSGSGTDGSIPASVCSKYACTTSAEEGQCTSGAYLVRNDMWNTSATLGPQTLYVCSYNSWYVVSNQTDQGGAILTYPDVQLNYGTGSGTPISSFHSMTSTFSETSPHVGDYEDAFDIWINGFGDGHTELMIWVDTYKQVPGGSKVTTATFDGRAYDVWRSPGSSGQYLAFVATTNFSSGTVDLLAIFNWTIARGWIDPDASLYQI
jgi:hypothetical protein